MQNENDYEEDMGSPNNSEELYTDEEAPFEEPPGMVSSFFFVGEVAFEY